MSKTKLPEASSSSMDNSASNPPENQPTGEKKPVETYLAGLKHWEVAAIKAHLNVPQGYAMTQSAFDEAKKEALEAEVE